jgi:hypothetical protein
MPNGLAMENRVAELELRLAAVEQRLNRLERNAPTAAVTEELQTGPTIGDGFLSNAPTLIGRVLLIFGGAFLLRAITESEVLPTALGISIGAAYALFWLFMAYRKSALVENRAGALFYGGASVLLLLPLLFEAAGKFQLLSGNQGLTCLALFCGVSLWVATKRDLRLLGWLVTAGGILTAFVLLKTTRSTTAASVVLILLGIGALWACYVRHWKGPQWLAAAGANIGVLTMVLLGTSEQWDVAPRSALYLGGIMLSAYFVSFAIYSHIQKNHVGFFEPVQSLFAVAVTALAAVFAARAEQIAIAPVGLLTLLFAAAAYALAFTPATRTERGRNFFFYSSLGLLLLVLGSALLLSPTVAAGAWSLLAISMAWFSGRYGRVALSLQCTFLLLAAGVGSGILTTGWLALAGADPTIWPPLVGWHVLVALTTVACLIIPVAQHSDRWGTLAGLPQLIVLALSVWEVGGLMVAIAAPLLAGAGTPDANVAVVAALRTAVLAAASVTLALSSRFKRWPEARWLVYPVLVLVGVKLFLEDFPIGEPAMLFVSLVLVGSALILVAKLLARTEVAS